MQHKTAGLFGVTAALIMGASPLLAGGIERADQGLGPLFETGNYLELGFSHVKPSVSGHDLIPGAPTTGKVAHSFNNYSLAYKHDFTENLSGAIFVDAPFGADVSYPLGQSLMLGGTRAKVSSHHVTGVLRWHNPEGFGVHGGLRVARSDADVHLEGLAFGAASDYSARLARDTGWGWLVGVSYEIPDYAARVSLTYNSPIKHKFHTTESAPLAPLNGISTTEVSAPRSWNLEFQSGIAPDTLLFGAIRWVKWSEFKVDPERLMQVTGVGLVDLGNTTTYTLGVGRKFTDQWSGSAAITWENKGKDLVSPLAPTSGRKGVTLAAIYTQDNMKITTGVNFSRLGDAKPATGLPPEARAQMKDSDVVSVGVRLGFTF